MNFFKNSEDSQVGMLLSPMVDMMFLLLIYFMVSSVLAQQEKKMSIQLPKVDPSSMSDTTRKSREIIINLDKDGNVEVNQMAFKGPEGLKSLGGMLDEISQNDATQRIIIRADRETKHEDVMAVMDLCRQANIINMGIAALPKGK
jgi:biopolymer transport protein ExbD